MKIIQIVFGIALVLFVACTECLALRLVQGVSNEEAKNLGFSIRSEVVGTNQIGVWLEFGLKGKLERFSHAELEIISEGRRLVSATLLPLKQTEESVVVYFSTAPAYLPMSTLTVIVRRSRDQDPDGYRLSVGDFIKHEPAR